MGHDGQSWDDDHARLSEALRLSYADATGPRRRRLQRRFAEKYLASRPVYIGTASDEDVAAIPTSFETLRYIVNRLAGNQQLPAVPPAVEDALETWRARGMMSYPVPPMRALEGELFYRLDAVDLAHFGRDVVSPRFVAAIVLLAYDVVGLN